MMDTLGTVLNLSINYEVALPDVLAEDFGDEVVVLCLTDGRYLSFSGIAAVAWRDLASGHPPQVLIDAAVSVRPDMAPALTVLFSAILTAALLRPSTVNGDLPPPGLLAALPGAIEVPEFSIFDDMADMIRADPIHDVDKELGWPAMQQAVSSK